MDKITDGGPAFPYTPDRHEPVDDQITLVKLGQIPGMSLRDHFAGLAMQGWILAEPTLDGLPLSGTEDHAGKLAITAYVYADAMLKARG